MHHTHTKLISDLKSGDYRNNKFTLSTAVVGYTRAINIHCVNLDMGFWSVYPSDTKTLYSIIWYKPVSTCTCNLPKVAFLQDFLEDLEEMLPW